MPNFDYTWTDEQIKAVNGRAIRIFQELTDDEILPDILKPTIYQGILNQCGQVEITQVQKGTVLPRMDPLRQR